MNHTSESWTEEDQANSEPDFYGKWVSVNEKPKGVWSPYHSHLSEHILIANDLCVLVGFYNRHNGFWCTDDPADNNWVDDVTHWMPLPKLPTL